MFTYNDVMNKHDIMNSEREKIMGFYKNRKRMPSYSEMLKLFGFNSKNSVYKLVDRLVKRGIVGKDRTGRLIPNDLRGQVPLLGLVEAGFPSAAEEELVDTMSIDEYLIERKESTYMLEVKGDSMIDAGIQEGDLVIVERGREPKVGNIVIAEVDGGWTMKYFKKDRSGRVYLEPANKAYKAIYPENDMKIGAVVKGVIRKY